MDCGVGVAVWVGVDVGDGVAVLLGVCVAEGDGVNVGVWLGQGVGVVAGVAAPPVWAMALGETTVAVPGTGSGGSIAWRPTLADRLRSPVIRSIHLSKRWCLMVLASENSEVTSSNLR